MTYEQFRVDYRADPFDDHATVEYFEADRAKAVACARKISRRRDDHGFPFMAYLIRSTSPDRFGLGDRIDTGQLVYCDGRIVEREGETK